MVCENPMANQRCQWGIYVGIPSLFSLYPLPEYSCQEYATKMAFGIDLYVFDNLFYSWKNTGGGVINLNYLTWFSIIHIIASYIRFYPMKRGNDTHFWKNATLLSIALAMLSVVVIRLTGLGAYYLVSDSNAPFALLVAICSFMLFKSIEIPYSKFVNSVAAGTFGVFLIHTNGDAMRQWLWNDTLQNVTMFGTPYLYVHAVLSVVGVFCVCEFIDWVRRLTIEETIINFAEIICRKIVVKLNCK